MPRVDVRPAVIGFEMGREAGDDRVGAHPCRAARPDRRARTGAGLGAAGEGIRRKLRGQPHAGARGAAQARRGATRRHLSAERHLRRAYSRLGRAGRDGDPQCARALRRGRGRRARRGRRHRRARCEPRPPALRGGLGGHRRLPRLGRGDAPIDRRYRRPSQHLAGGEARESERRPGAPLEPALRGTVRDGHRRTRSHRRGAARTSTGRGGGGHARASRPRPSQPRGEPREIPRLFRGRGRPQGPAAPRRPSEG